MTDYHRTPEWKAFTRQVRPMIQASLPAPCVNRCKKGGIVAPGDRWDVAHLPGHDAYLRRGDLSINHVGPAHSSCNRSDGGRVGAALTNKSRLEHRARDERFLPW